MLAGEAWGVSKMSKAKVLVFLDVSIDGDPYERMVFEVSCSLNAVLIYL